MSTPSSINQGSRLSVAIIVRDAEAALAETLRSVRPFADEIIVCDTGSTDDTVRIAENMMAKVVRHKWADDFSAARNECLSHVCGDWVLWLDAGEWIEEQDAEVFREFLQQKADPVKAYMMLVKIPAAGPTGAAEQVARIRLVPTHPAVKFKGRVRESLAESLGESGIGIEGLAAPIRRGQREHQEEIMLRKANRNLLIASQEIEQNGPSAQLLNCLAEAYATAGAKDAAVEQYRRALEASERGSAEMLEAYYGLLTSLDGSEEVLPERLSLCLEALDVFPLDTQLLCAMGGYLRLQGRLDLAIRSFQTACKYGQVNPEIWHLQEIRQFAVTCYCVALQLNKQDDEALQTLEEALAEDETAVRLRRLLIDLYIKHGRQSEALSQIDLLGPDVPQIEALRSAVRGACLASQKNWIAAKAYLDAAYEAECRDLICLRWLSVTLLSTGRLKEAEPIIEQWQEMEPANAEVQKYLQLVAASEQEAESAGEATAPIEETTPQEADMVRFDVTATPNSAPVDADGHRHLRIDQGTEDGSTSVPGPNVAEDASVSETAEPPTSG